MTTTQQIREAIKSEPNEPQDTILRVLKEHDAKPLTVRVTRAINKALGWDGDGYYESVRIVKRYGMTHIEWGTYKESASLLIAHQEENVQVDAKDIEERNSAYFAAKDERNASRALITSDQIDELALAMAAFETAKQQLEHLLDYDGVFSADCCKLEKIAGIE